MKLPLSFFLMSAAGAMILLVGTAETAQAHVCMDFPVSRVGPDCTFRSPQKVGSCPVADRSEHVNAFRPGETIRVILRETIDHPSHYRIAFNPDGDTFTDPVSIDDVNSGHPYTLLDGIVDDEEAGQEVEITFPEVECENCTLQLIQVMHDKQENGFGGASGGEDDNDDIYYSCADIVLRGEPVASVSDAVPDPEKRAGAGLWGIIVVAGALGASFAGRRSSR